MAELSADIAAVLAGEHRWHVEHASMLDLLPLLPADTFDSCVCDPPYELGFMGRAWDRSGIAFRPETWAAVLRVLKPGAHLTAFGGSRTAHRIACAIEDAGFEIRDSLSYFYGSGFPKSLNVNNAIADAVCCCPEALSEHAVRSVQNSDVPETVSVESREGTVLFESMPEQDAPEHRQERTESEPGGREQSGLEGRCDVFSQARELQTDQVRAVPASIPGNGAKGRVRDGAPLVDRESGAADIAQSGGRASRRPRSAKQRAQQPRAVAGQPQSQTSRGWATCRRCGKPVVPAGLGTALKPGHEPIILARKPLDGTVAANVLEHGTGALNINGCRVAHASPKDLAAHEAQVAAIKARGGSMENSWKNSSDLSGANDVSTAGRWPPNVLLTHSASCKVVGTRSVKANPTWDTPNRATEPSAFTGATVSQVRHAEDVVAEYECAADCPVRELDEQSGELTSGTHARRGMTTLGIMNDDGWKPPGRTTSGHDESGTASRFFPQSQWDPQLDDVARFIYCAKAGRSERDLGLDHFRARSAGELTVRVDGTDALNCPRSGAGRTGGARNPHPTVKPVELLRWLVRLVTRPKGLVLDPFSGSGSCGMAALLEGFRYLGIELNDTDEEPFVSIARARITWIEGGNYVPRESLRSANPPRQGVLFG